MAATPAGAQLTEAHRLAQVRIGRQAMAEVAASFVLLDPRRIDATSERWLLAVVPLVRALRRRSAALSAAYVTGFRAAELGEVRVQPAGVMADEIDPAAVVTSLTVTGLVAVKALTGRGVPVEQAAQQAALGAGRAAMRHALDGGRETVLQVVQSDGKALGWARATSGRACGFCAMLASRGPVYGADTAGFDAHDGCSCTPEPVFRSDADWPAGARDYRALWNESTDGLSQQDAVNAFRRALGR